MAIAFSASRDAFKRLIERVVKVVERRNTIPILGNVVVCAEADGRLSITGTDLDVWIVATAPGGTAEVGSPGKTTVPAQMLSDILRKLDADRVTLTSDGQNAVLSAGRARFKMNELPVIDFPDMPLAEMSVNFNVSGSILRRVVDCVSFAISTEEVRYYLNGIFMEAEEFDGRQWLSAVATDGHRLSKVRQPTSDETAKLPGIIVPRKTVGLLTLIADSCDDDETIAVSANDSRIEFRTHSLQVRSKLVDGTYPDYRRVIPGNEQRMIEIAPDKLVAAVDRVSSVSSERGRAIKFSFADGSLTLQMESPDAGEAADEVELGTLIDVDGFEIGFNGKYIQEALRTFGGDMIRIAFNDPGSPALITDLADASRQVVLMPMRV